MMKNLMLCMITAILLCPIQPAPCQPSNAELAKAILDNQDFPVVMEKAKAILKTGFSAGEGYGEVWIRDLATFIEISCQVYDPAVIRENLLVFFHFQGEDGNIPDGFIPAEKASVSYEYILSNSQPTLRAHKNTVETDQESSLLQAVHRYIQRTGDATILEAEINGKPVLQRLEMALEFLFTKRFNDKYGLIWGATTADWGDVQPEHEWGVFLNDDSHLTLDIYDNAMAVIAITDFIAMAKDHPEKVEKWVAAKKKLSKNIRTHLWDAKNQKYIPHIYLDGSPFPADFNENEIYYHGGTAVAIQAGLLTPEEIQTSLETMRKNVKATGAQTIGLTMYPPYPAGFFKNPVMSPYSYQNGGDWTWFGGRMIQGLIQHGFIADAYKEIQPMTARVIKNDGFFEWYKIDGTPAGSGIYRGSAGVLGKSIEMLQDWAKEQIK